MNNLIIIHTINVGESENSLKASELHKMLKVKSKFPSWIQRRISKNSFIENFDYIKQSIQTEGRPFIEHYVTLDMAKHLCMLENNEVGMSVRKYFIEVEKQYRQSLLAPQKQLQQQVSALTQELYNTKRELTEARRLLGRIEYNNSQVKPAVIEGRRGGANATLDFLRYEERSSQTFELLSQKYQEFAELFGIMQEANSNLKMMKSRFHTVYPELNEKVQDINVIEERR